MILVSNQVEAHFQAMPNFLSLAVHLGLVNEFRCYEAKIEQSEKGRQPPGVEPGTFLA